MSCQLRTPSRWTRSATSETVTPDVSGEDQSASDTIEVRLSISSDEEESLSDIDQDFKDLENIRSHIGVPESLPLEVDVKPTSTAEETTTPRTTPFILPAGPSSSCSTC